MTSQERIRAAIARESLDRVPMLEIGFWNETVERFYREGIPRDFVFQSPLWGGGAYHTEHTLEDYFGLDRIAVMAYDGSLRLEQETLEETETYRIFRNADGLTYKAFQNVTAPPLCMDFSVKTRADWEALKERLAADTSRCLPGFAEAYGSAKKKDAYKVIKPEEGCQYAIYLLGDEACYVNMVPEPDWIEDIIRTYTERQIEMMEIILGQGYEFDAMWVFSDLCYKNDMLFSPAFYRGGYASFRTGAGRLLLLQGDCSNLMKAVPGSCQVEQHLFRSIDMSTKTDWTRFMHETASGRGVQHFAFAVAVCPAAHDGAAAQALLQAQRAPVSACARYTVEPGTAVPHGSLFKTEGADVQLSAAYYRDQILVLRLVETGGVGGTVHLMLPEGAGEVRVTDLNGTPMEKTVERMGQSASVVLHPYEICTLQISR